MIVVTGAAGFIGSNIVKGLNERGINDILAVDDLTQGDKFVNLVDTQIADYLDKTEFRQRVLNNTLPSISAVFHQGACSDTTERNGQYMMDNNYQVTRELFDYCQSHRIPLYYASSAAVYGAGPDYVEHPQYEKPLNVYGYSKLLFDQLLRRHLNDLKAPVVGLRYFNVYGGREQHKGQMSSVAFHNFNQFKRDGYVTLFEGWAGYENGAQQRDFIYINDVVKVNLHFFDRALSGRSVSGIFNCGTGRAQAFNDVAMSVVNTLKHTQYSVDELVGQGLLRYIAFPDHLKGRYQSYTQADITQLQNVGGYEGQFATVQQGVADYVTQLESLV